MLKYSDITPITYSRTPAFIARDTLGGTEHVQVRGLDTYMVNEGYEAGDNKNLGDWNWHSKLWADTNHLFFEEIAERFQPGKDILGIIGGYCNKTLVDAMRNEFGDIPVIEWGIGYSGVLPGTHKAFESSIWRSAVGGWNQTFDPLDRIIPNAYFRDEFKEVSTGTGSFVLYMGRIQEDKGMEYLRALSPKIQLVVAGAGDTSLLPPHAEHIGVVSGAEKRDLLSRAGAVLTPSTYLDPFCGVHVEALMSGCAVVATDWGVFHETISPDRNGYLINSPSQVSAAVYDAIMLTSTHGDRIQKRARERFSIEAVSPAYISWLMDIKEHYGLAS